MNTQSDNTATSEKTKDYLDLEQIKTEIDKNTIYKPGSKNDIAFKNGAELALEIIADILTDVYNFEEIGPTEDNQ